MEITRKHSQNNATGKLKYLGTNSGGHGQWDMSVKIHPNEPTVQVIARQVSIHKIFIYLIK